VHVIATEGIENRRFRPHGRKSREYIGLIIFPSVRHNSPTIKLLPLEASERF